MNNEEKIYDLLEKIYLELQDTRTELKDTKSDLQTEIGSVKSDLQTEIGSVKSDLQAEIGSVKSDLQAEIGSIKSDLTEFRAETNRRFDGLEDKIDDIEANNASRYVSINGDLKRIKAGLSKVEIVTADNWGDIARLKFNRKNKAK